MKAVYKKRLLNVAKALRESPAPERFSMEYYAHRDCGTPACALGHYAARRDIQRTFTIERDGAFGFDIEYEGQIGDHFGLFDEEVNELFGTFGCRDAKTPAQAARYIERFVARKERE